MMRIMSRPFVKTSGFRLIVNLDLVSLYLLCSVDDFACKVCAPQLETDKSSRGIGE